MADNIQIHNDIENSQSSVKTSIEEWTIIGETSSEKESSDDSIEYIERITDAREATEGLDELTTSDDNNEDKIDAETGVIVIEKQCDDSDGISVITESEPEQFSAENNFTEFDSCKNHLCSTLQKYEKPAPQVGAVLNVIIACSLAAIIGLGAGRIFQMDDNCPVSNAIDFSTLKMESDKLINQLKDLSEVKDVLDELRASIPRVKQSPKTSRQKRSKMSEKYIFHPDTTILEQLETSLNTLSTVIDEISPDQNDFASSDASETQNIVADLIEFQKLMNTVMTELGDAESPNQIAFLRNAEMRIKDVSRSLLNDLTYTVRNLTNKIHRKLNKVRQKLNRRLCLMKNTEPVYCEIFESLKENNSFLESCEKILTVSLKPEASDSSMPDLCYKRNVDISEKMPKNDIKRRKTRESLNSSRAPSLESLMMEIIVPEKPLYSTILKAVSKTDKSNDSRNSNFDNQGKKNSVEAEPVEVKNREKKPVKKCPRSEERSFNTQERSDNTDEMSPPSIGVNYCKKGKKCFNDTSAASGSRKKQKKKDTKKKTHNEGDNGNKKSRKGINSVKSKKDYKKKDEKLKFNDQLPGDWQTQRSRSRAVNRDRHDRLGWFFDRADSRQKARKRGDSVKIPEYHRSKMYSPVFGERSDDEEFLNEWLESKEMNERKHGGNRGTFKAKKMLKMPHRKNIIQSKYR